MSKIILFVILSTIISCGNEKAPSTSGPKVGVEKRYEPLEVSPVDQQQFVTICNSLMEKEGLLSVLVSSRTEYHFSFAQKNCAETSLPSPRTILTVIGGFSPHFSFQAKNGEYVGFPSVETISQGVLTEICQELQSGRTLRSPMQTNKGAIWFRAPASGSNCLSGPGEQCIHIQTGAPSERADHFKIHTEEWIKIRTQNPRRGFWIERRLISTANCPVNQQLEKVSHLK